MKSLKNAKPEIAEYIRLVYGKDSPISKIVDIQEKKQVALDKTGASISDDDEGTRRLILEFLREQNHYKHSLLISKQELYWESLEVLREPLKKSTDDDKRLKNIKLKGDLNDLCSKLVSEIDVLYDNVYTLEFKEEAQKGVITFEQRLQKK